MIRHKLVTRLLLALSTLSPTTLLFPEASVAEIVYNEPSLEDVTVLTYFRGDIFTTVPGNTSRAFSLTCPQDFDRHVVSGGIDSQNSLGRGFNIVDSYPTTTTTWFIRIYNDTPNAQNVRPFIVCAS